MKKMFITERSIEEYRKILIKEEKGRLTVEKYVRDMKKFYEYAKGKCISKQLVIDYKYYIESTGDYKISSINSFLASVNHYLEVMNCADMKVKMIKVQKNMFVPEKRELTKGEYECLIDTAASIGNEQLALIIQTLGSTGIRISELKSCFHIFDCLYKCFGSSLIWHILICNTSGNCKVMQLRIDGFSIAFKNHWENYGICKSMRNIIFATERMCNCMDISYI